MQTLNIPITGMSCGGCVENVRTALSSISGVTDAQVKVGAATVTFDPARTSPEVLRGAILKAGYSPAAS